MRNLPPCDAVYRPRPQATPSFSMLHAEKREGLVCERTCVTPSPRNATYVEKGHRTFSRSCLLQATDIKRKVYQHVIR